MRGRPDVVVGKGCHGHVGAALAGLERRSSDLRSVEENSC